MQNANLRNMFNLLRYPLTGALLVLLSTISLSASAQMNMEEHDRKPYYFGITLAANQSYFRLSHSDLFLHQDSIMVAEPLKTVGFNLGLLANLRLTNRFDLRFNPQLFSVNKNLYFRENYPDSATEKESGIHRGELPQIKFKSDRIGNMRVYTIVGMKLDHDLASNKSVRLAEDLVKVNKTTYGFELGAGLNFHFYSFIFTPEFKISNGLNDVHVRDSKPPLFQRDRPAQLPHDRVFHTSSGVKFYLCGMQNVIIRNISVVNEGVTSVQDVWLRNGRIEKIASQISETGKEIDGTGKHLLPGVIDDQVHFREPGLTHKANIRSEARAAVAGGTTKLHGNAQYQTRSRYTGKTRRKI